MAAPICFIDTETDSLNPDRTVWDVGIIRRDDVIGQVELQFFVDINLAHADLRSLEIGGFYRRHPVGRALSAPGHPLDWTAHEPAFHPGDLLIGAYLNRAGAARLIARTTHRAHIIGAVPNFDTDVLAPLLREHGYTPAWHYHIMDVETMAVAYLLGQGQPPPELPWKSDELLARIGVEPPTDDERHTALGDARWVARAWDLMHTRRAVCKHPRQPVHIDDHGVERFVRNEIINSLYEDGHIDLNKIATMRFDADDRRQLAQLLGYSLAGYDDLTFDA